MRLQLLLLGLPLLAATHACKDKDHVYDQITAAMTRFKDMMCACKDKACAEKVQEEMTKWAQDMAKNAGDRKPEPMPEEKQKQYTEVAIRMAECAQKAMTADAAPPDPSVPAADAAPPPEKITNADRLIKLTYDDLGGRAVQRLAIQYVRADGTMDDEYGEALFELGRPKPRDPADDPKRPLGAPVRKLEQERYEMTRLCPQYTWKRGTRFSEDRSCQMSGYGIERPKCSVVEVWKRAIDKGAPAEGLAVLVAHEGPPQTWSFAIDDEPRKVHVAIDIEDTCAPTLEKPR